MPMATLTSTVLDVRPLTRTIGAEIRGVDLRQTLDHETVAQIRQALFAHHVVFLPDQYLDPDQHVAFARQLGEITLPAARLAPLDEDHKDVVAFDSRNFVEEYRRPGRHRGWHADVTFQASPPLGAVFNVVTLPSVGGSTFFASTQEGYDTLSPLLQEFLGGLSAVHQYGSVVDRARPEAGEAPLLWEGEPIRNDEVVHPVVAVHPVTGRKSLFVNPQLTARIVGLSEEESDTLLDFLYDHTLKPENILRYHWTEGTIGIWDNRAVWHRRADDFDPSETRIVHRVQLRGPAPVGPAR
jgi:alpha-ketoglutarate-dependent taurine dioxygenase